jgi:hypothetical protein
MERNIKASQTRARQYWFADGLMELGAAVTCLMLAIFFLALQIIPIMQAGFALLFLLVFVAAYGLRKLMIRYRERSTYPLTGFVEPQKGWQDRWLLGITIGFTILLLGFMLFTILRGIQTMVWMPVIGGVIYTFIFAFTGYRTKIIRFYFLAGFCLALGVLLSLNGMGDFLGAAVLSFSASLVLFTFGIVTRYAYIHQSSRVVDYKDEN